MRCGARVLSCVLRLRLLQVAVQVVHFDSKATGVVSQCHGNPFFFSVSEADTVKSTKDRIRTKLDMRKTEEFKLFVFFGTHQHHLSDGMQLCGGGGGRCA